MKNGADILVLIDLGTETTPNYQLIGCQRDSNIEEVSEAVDFSCKDSRAQRVDYGRYSSTISLDALYIASAADWQKLKSANRNGNFVILASMVEGVIVQRARSKIDSIPQNFPDQGEATISASFQVDGEIVSSWVIGEGVIGSVFIA